MITIEELLAREEGQTFDRKSIQIKPKDLAVAMVAMANADGGDLVVGISDTKREVEGVDGNEIKLNDIRRTPFDFCVPSVNAITELVPCIDRNGQHNHVLVFHIEPGLRVYANQADEVFLRVGDKSKKTFF
ncbi:MAG: ATP-binding protein [Bacteroides intestinalis]|nr:ATP-binding protein [Bacteroides intestinalis]